MGVSERREVEEFLRTLPNHEDPSWDAEHLWHERGITHLSRAWPRLPIAGRVRVGRKVSGEVVSDLQAILGQLKREEFQSALNITINQLVGNIAGIAGKLSEAGGQARTHERIEALEARVGSLETRVALLEERPEMPIRPLPDEGDPFTLLRQLRLDLGEDRFKWFIEDE